MNQPKTKEDILKDFIQENGYRYEYFNIDRITDTHIRDYQRDAYLAGWNECEGQAIAYRDSQKQEVVNDLQDYVDLHGPHLTSEKYVIIKKAWLACAESMEVKHREEVMELKKKAQMNIHNSAFNGLLSENNELKKEIQELRAFKAEALEVIEMVEDNRKMPHQHSDYHTRLCCLSERAREFLTKHNKGE